MRDRVVLETACPVCGAEPGERCWWESPDLAKVQTNLVHADRVTAWKAAQPE